MSKVAKPAYIKEIIKQHGNIILTGNQLLEKKRDEKIVSISPAIDMALGGGVREGTWIMLSGKPKCGKAQPNSSYVYTPDGPKLMCEMCVGDEVCTPSGGTAKVIGIYPQGTRPVYKLTFNDNSSCRADAEHLWKVIKNSCRPNRKDDWVIKTTEELSLDLAFQDRMKWILSPVTSMYFTGCPTSIDPYLFGVIISSSFKSSKRVIFRKLKPEVRSAISESVYGDPESVKCNTILDKDLCKILLQNPNILDNKLRYIPSEYKYNSIEVRMAVLRGIFDSRGLISSSDYIEYSSSSPQFMNDVAEICRSLGYYARVSFVTKHKRNKLVVRGELLQDLFLNRDGSTLKNQIKNKIIEKIEYIGEDRCRCIELDDENHLYVTNGVNATHNTTTAMQLAYNCQLEGRPVIYINSEGRLHQLNFEVEGLDPEKMIIVTAEDKPLSAEIFLDVTHKLISMPENRGALCIIDSISSLIPEKDLIGEVSGSLRPGLPRVLSNFVKKTGQIVPNNRNIMCMITHIISNTGTMGAPPSMADGGIKIQFQADTRMEAKTVTPWENSSKQRIGQALDWKIYYSGQGAKEYGCQSWIRYGHGIDKTQELIIIGQELALIDQAGSWMTCDFVLDDPQFLHKINPEIELGVDGQYKDEKAATSACKFQGQDKLYAFVSQPIVLERLKKKIEEMMI